MKVSRIVGIAGLLVCIVNAGVVQAANQEPKQKVAAYYLPVDFEAYKFGIDQKKVPLPDTSREAREQLDRSLQLAFTHIGTFDPVAMPGCVFSRSNSRGGGALMICAWLVIR